MERSGPFLTRIFGRFLITLAASPVGDRGVICVDVFSRWITADRDDETLTKRRTNWKPASPFDSLSSQGKLSKFVCPQLWDFR
jgi:hypothetical protein